MPISLKQATEIAEAAFEEGRRLALQPLTIAILDSGGCLILLMRDDGSSLLRPEIALGKAWGVLGMGFGGYELARRAEQAPQFFTALSSMSHGRMVPVPGGVIVRDKNGAVQGSVGISGDASVQDSRCAVVGIVAAKFVADTGE